jgi:hypothetical protein
MESVNKEPILLNQKESSELIASTEDIITNRLMNAACYCIIKRFLENKSLPVADFDMRFFSEAMLEFCSNHELLRKILDGKEVGWFADE